MKTILSLFVNGDASSRRESNYLANAKSLSDLEYRQRQVNAGVLRPQRPIF